MNFQLGNWQGMLRSEKTAFENVSSLGGQIPVSLISIRF